MFRDEVTELKIYTFGFPNIDGSPFLFLPFCESFAKLFSGDLIWPRCSLFMFGDEVTDLLRPPLILPMMMVRPFPFLPFRERLKIDFR